MPLHKDLTGADLHEPKGVSGATSGQVYRADGAGSGSWQTLTLPTGTFTVTSAEFTASGTWTKPANFFGAMCYLIGGGGGAGGSVSSGGTGGTSSIGSIISVLGGAGGQGGGGTNGGAGGDSASGSGTSLFKFSGSAGLNAGGGGTGGIAYGPFANTNTPSYYGSGSTSPANGGGGGAAFKCAWITNAQTSSSEAITVGAGGTAGDGAGVVGKSGYVLIIQYTTA